MERDIIAIKEELRSIKVLLEKMIDMMENKPLFVQNDNSFLREILERKGDCFDMDCGQCPLDKDSKSPCSNCRDFFLDVEKTRLELCKYIKNNYLREE